MAEIDDTIRSDLRADFGDANGGWDNTEIDRIWTRMAGAKDEQTQYYATLAMMFFQARNNAAKFHDVGVAGDSHKLSQIYKHYDELYQEYAPFLKSVLGTNQQIYKASLRAFERQGREKPNE